jgi:hypothetical protein
VDMANDRFTKQGLGWSLWSWSVPKIKLLTMIRTRLTLTQCRNSTCPDELTNSFVYQATLHCSPYKKCRLTTL